jgi:REP element-mobilizing transposase RayT
LSDQFNYVGLDEWIIMPNHLHGILQIKDINKDNDRNHNATVGNVVGTGRDLSLQTRIKPLSDIIGAFKTTTSKLIHLSGSPEFQWQRSFYDHIIRNEKDFYRIKKYIQENTINWEFDRNNKENLYM